MSEDDHGRRKPAISPAFASAMAAMAVLYVAVDAVWGLPPRGDRFAIGHDFVNMWMGAKFALSGDISTLFDWPRYVPAMRAEFWPEMLPHNWSYPPHVLLFTWPLGLLPYHAALVLWDLLGLSAFFLAIRFAMKTVAAPDRFWLIVAAMGAPVVASNIVLGQFGLFIGALCVAAWLLRDKRPIVAGILIGILTIKPHLGLLWPVLLLIERRFAVIASAVATTGLLVVVTSAIFGWSAFPDYIAYAAPTQSLILVDADLSNISPTPMMMARILGLPAEYGYGFVAIIAPLAFVAFVYVMLKSVDDAIRFAMFGTATFLVLPYAFTYDSAMLIAPIILLLQRTERPGPRLIMLMAYLLPLLGMISPLIHLPVAAISLMLLAGFFVVETTRASSADRGKGGRPNLATTGPIDPAAGTEAS